MTNEDACLICGIVPTCGLVDDHCHEHGHHRGRICHSCNQKIRHFDGGLVLSVRYRPFIDSMMSHRRRCLDCAVRGVVAPIIDDDVKGQPFCPDVVSSSDDSDEITMVLDLLLPESDRTNDLLVNLCLAADELARRRKTLTDTSNKLAAMLRRRGMSWREIERRMDVSARTVRRWAMTSLTPSDNRTS